jgi:hypothetical protein
VPNSVRWAVPQRFKWRPTHDSRVAPRRTFTIRAIWRLVEAELKRFDKDRKNRSSCERAAVELPDSGAALVRVVLTLLGLLISGAAFITGTKGQLSELADGGFIPGGRAA